MIAIIDYGAGNLFSVKNALDYIGLPYLITKDPAQIIRAQSLILPGVGAFPKAMDSLHATGLTDLIKQQAAQKPLLGICLGMQMLFEESTEFTLTKGLGLISGRIDRIVTDQKIPHMGWNTLELNEPCPLLQGIPAQAAVYFVHSYRAFTDPQNVAAYCDYSQKIPALVQNGSVFGCQFHPEKSGDIGLQILRNFGGLTR